MNIPALGALIPYPDVPGWLQSGPIVVPFFEGRTLTFTLDSLTDADESDIRNAVDGFLRLTTVDRDRAAKYVFANYQKLARLVSAEDLGCEIPSADDVWEHVHPTEIYVSRRHRYDRAIYVQVAAECDWEPEHGLQIIYRRGAELSRVSDQDGHLTRTDAYDLPEDRDKIA